MTILLVSLNFHNNCLYFNIKKCIIELEVIMKEEIKNATNAALTNTKTIIMINILLVILVIISLGVSIYSLNILKKSNITTTEEKQEEETEYDVSMFTKIDTDKFIDLYNKDEKSLIYLGRSTCGYCVKFLPNLQKAQKEYGYKTYYLDITTVNDKGVKKIQKLDSFLKDNYGYTPMVLVVKDGKILNKAVDNYEGIGYTEYKTFEKFLKKLDYEKK